MKVTGIKSYAFADDEGKLYFIAKVETDEGIYGLGEVGIPRWGNAVASAIEHLSELVVGQDPFGTERLWQHMFRGGFFPADKVYCCAISAIDIALWDIKGKALGMPVYKLLGGPVRDKVVSYPHTQGSTTEELIANSKRAVADGWKFVRWGLAETGGVFEYQGVDGLLEPVESMRIAEEQMALVRDAVGPDIQMCLDIHTRLDTAHTVALCKALEPYRPVLHRRPAALGKPRELPHTGAACVAADCCRGAVGEQMAVPRGHRGGVDKLRAHRPLHRRRANGSAEDYALGGDALH